MLTRRHIRIKVMQALYQHQQTEGFDISTGEKNLRKSIDRIFELYLYELKALTDILRIAQDQVEKNRNKHLATYEDLNPNLRFVENPVLNLLAQNEAFRKELEFYHISFGDDRDLLRNIYREFQRSSEYKEYMGKQMVFAEDHQRIVRVLYGAFITQNELLYQVYEEKSLHWADDLDAAQMMVTKTIKKYKAGNENLTLLPLLKDDSDMDFAIKLYRKVISNGKEYEEQIFAKAKNWESDRIAIVDIILMKMALAEMLSFTDIPVKVTINEYIELSKDYSTNKSATFINGIIDNLRKDLEDEGAIRKIGRGLL